MNRVLWILLVIFLSLIASVLGATLRNALRSKKSKGKKRRRHSRFEDEDEEGELDTTRNAPKGEAAVIFWILAGIGGGVLLLMVGFALFMIVLESMDKADPGNNPGVPPPAPHFEQKPIEPPVSEDLGPKEKITPILGGAVDPTFKDQAGAGGLLIGYDVGLGELFGVELVKWIQPIYRTPQGEDAGRTFGTEFTRKVSVKAKQGYAVGAINVKAGLMVNGFSTTFMRVKGNRLDPKDAYSSPWVGDTTGGNPPVFLAGDGTPIIGLIGKRNVRDFTGIGLLKR